MLSSEQEVLCLIDQFFPSSTPHTPFGRGHDCAELVCSSNLALSTDFFWQDTHFRTSYFTPEEVGAKALGRAVSDLAAAGAKPLGFSLGLMLPTGMGKETLRLIFSGMSSMAHDYGIVLSGGDLSKGERLGFCLTVWGESVKENFFLKRKQSHQGDYIFAIGGLGLANAGLMLLEALGRKALDQYPTLCRAHLSMTPLVKDGMILADIAYAYPEARIALMDASDGLLSDLPRLIEGYAANLTFGEEVLEQELQTYSLQYDCNPEAIAIKGGEDYALLGTCSKESFAMIKREIPRAYVVGEVREGSGVYRHGKELRIKGFDHFVV